MQSIAMAVLPKCDIEDCNIDAVFDVPVQGQIHWRYLCRTHFIKIGDKYRGVGNYLRLAHKVDVSK